MSISGILKIEIMLVFAFKPLDFGLVVVGSITLDLD